MIVHFIYVMDETSRDRLLELGYKLMATRGDQPIWVFDNPTLGDVDGILDEPYIMSDILTF